MKRFCQEHGEKRGFMEQIGRKMDYLFKDIIGSYLEIAAEITYWSIVDLFKKKTHRKGEVVNQAVLMGVNAALIVGLCPLLLGWYLPSSQQPS